MAAQLEEKPSTEGAVGIQIYFVSHRYAARFTISFMVPEPTAMGIELNDSIDEATFSIDSKSAYGAGLLGNISIDTIFPFPMNVLK